MPFTPFHFGPGLLLKAAAPYRVSFTSFAVTQVVVDVETLYHLVRQQWPVHRQLHSVVGGVAVGLLIAGTTVAARPALDRIYERLASAGAGGRAEWGAETSWAGAIVGGVLGGASHSILDALVHSDVHPLWPISAANPLIGLVAPNVVHIVCVLAAMAGVSWLWLASRRRRLVV